ncbi:MAG: aromatic ring-hydroxylating dioxygenase subunit alpha [Roseovarius sp.]|nr:aromatic ring-hydroxylating dioxygenase subunit alpha [Roseovarius sp.]
MATYANLENVLNDIEQSTGLPNAHYTDSTLFEEEKHALIFSEWAGLAVASEIPEPGDAKPYEFLGMPILMVRDDDGAVRVFQNICRHRGMILVSEPRRIEGAIRCPYHSWCYSKKGKLISTPHVGGPGRNVHKAIDRGTLGLVEIRNHVWMDVVWINVSGDAPAFADRHSDLIDRWADFNLPLHHGGNDSRFELGLDTNWKLAIENYCESYHLPWIHPGLNSYSRLEDHYNIELPGLYSGQGSKAYRQLKGEDGEKFADFHGVGEKWREQAEYIAVYPNVMLGVHRDHTFTIILEPVSISKTIEHVHIYYSEANTQEKLRRKNTAQWKEIFIEDIFVVEGMQRGRSADGFDGGRFSPIMDTPTHCFHQWAASSIQSHRSLMNAAE